MNNLLDKIKESLKCNNNCLIGDVDFNEEELEYLKEQFLKAISCLSINELNEFHIEIFIIYVINKFKEFGNDFDDTSFWGKVSYFFDENSNIEKIKGKSSFYDRLQKTLSRYNVGVFKSDTNKRLFAQTFLFQAYSPKDSLDAFVQMAWKQFVENFELDYTDDDRIIVEDTINKLGNKFSSMDEDEDIPMGEATYKLKAALKYGIKQDKLSAIHLLDRIYCYIQEVYINNEISTESHLSKFVLEKVLKLKKIYKKENKNKKSEKNRKIRKVYTIEDFVPTYIIDSSDNRYPSISILTPKITFLNNAEKYIIAEFRLKNNNEILTTEKVYIRNYEDNQILNSLEINMDCFLEATSYDFVLELLMDGKEVYNSRNLLKRNILVFDDYAERRGICSSNKYYYVFTPRDSNVKFYIKNEIDQLSENIYLFESSIGDSIVYKDGEINFGKVKRSQIDLPNDVNCHKYIKIIKNEEEFLLYDKMNNILISVPDNENSEKIIVRHIWTTIDNKIEEFDYNICELEKDGKRFIFKNINNQLNYKGFHDIYLIKITGDGFKSLDKINYCLYSKTNYQILDKLGYKNKGVKLLVTVLSNQYMLEFTHNQKETFIDCDFYKLKIDIPYFNWSFGSNFDNAIHTLPLNKETPFFLDEFTFSGETINIDTNIELEGIYFKDLLYFQIFMLPLI